MRSWLIEKRKAINLSRFEMAAKCDCSRTMIFMLEEDDEVTHPNIAARIAQGYGLSLEEYNKLVPKCHRANAIPKAKPRPTLNVLFSEPMREKMNERGEKYWSQ